MATFNIRAEVEFLLGRSMTKPELNIYRNVRACGMCNPYDILAQIMPGQVSK